LFQDGDNEAALCLDAATGKEIWRQRWPGKFNSPGGVGPRSTPAVADGRVYAVGPTGTFLCLDAATGEVRWRHELLTELGATNQEHGVSFSPLVEGDLVFTVPGAPGGAVAAFDRRDGRLVWKAFDDQAGYSSPIMATIAGKRQLVVLSGVSVMGINPSDGTLLWRYPWPTLEGTNAATPIAVGNYVFVSSSYSKGCALLVIADNGTGTLVAKPVYEHNRMRNHFGTCVLHDGHLYGFDETFLVCMELRTGKIRWKERGFNRGSLLLAGNRLLVLGDNGLLAIAEPDPAQFKQLAAATISQSTCWAMPALVDGKLYVRDQEAVMCFDLAQAKEQ
jgi:outer membrane protein assembly factor BamB